MSAVGVEQQYRAFDRSEFETPYAWVRAEQDEELRVVEVVRAAIPQASVYFNQGIVSVRATEGGATRDVVLVPGDRFTVTATTVIRIGVAPVPHGVHFEMTCASCPEQYDAIDKATGSVVGYLRLRSGRFTVQAGSADGDVLVSRSTAGDGWFEPEERDDFLILAAHELGYVRWSATDRDMYIAKQHAADYS